MFEWTCLDDELNQTQDEIDRTSGSRNGMNLSLSLSKHPADQETRNKESGFFPCSSQEIKMMTLFLETTPKCWQAMVFLHEILPTGHQEMNENEKELPKVWNRNPKVINYPQTRLPLCVKFPYNWKSFYPWRCWEGCEGMKVFLHFLPSYSLVTIVTTATAAAVATTATTTSSVVIIACDSRQRKV